MDLPLNKNDPTIMHIDLNSCFATVEQQANPLLWGKPLVVAAYASPNGCVISPSMEAKRLGIKVGMTVRDARLLCPEVTVKTPDPPSIAPCIFSSGASLATTHRASPPSPLMRR